jgi:predicted transposase YdaD
MLRYNALLSVRDGLPVESVLVLLRPEADGRALSGQLTYGRAERPPRLTFSYEVARLWELPAERILSGGLSTLPLAPLAKLEPTELPQLVEQMAERLEQEAGPAEAGELWAATYALFGLRYSAALAEQLLKGVRDMRESVTYQAILAEGRAEGEEIGRVEGLVEGRVEGLVEGRAQEARRLILALGERRFGSPSASVRASLDGIGDPETLERLGQFLLDASSWDDLLGHR